MSQGTGPKRREKIYEECRQRVLDQIKADKEARARAAAGEEGKAAEPSTAKPTINAAPAPVRNYDECKLQIRLTNGKNLMNTFEAKESLAAVRLFVQMNRSDGDEPFNLMTSFPKKVFTEGDMETPLSALGLVPSSVLILTRQAPTE